MPRLFFALWPDEEVREKIVNASKTLPKEYGRLVSQDNWHITLSFLGKVQQDNIPALLSASARIKTSNFSLQLDSCGWWSKPKIFYLAPSTVPAILNTLVEQVNAAVIDSGLSIEQRPYRPHLTLVRKVSDPADTFTFAPIPWDIKDFCLLESTSGQAGVQYQVVETWPLSSG